MPKYLVEFVGTFFLVLSIGIAAVLGVAGPYAPIAVAGVLTAMIYAGGPISKAHYNPAVTVAFRIRGLPYSAREIGGYLAAQILGALLASFVTTGIFAGGTGIDPLAPEPLAAFTAEFLFTFALVWTILGVGANRAADGNPYYGAAIGLVVLGGAYTVGAISLASFNPAVTLALFVMGKLGAVELGYYLAANFLGGIAATLAFNQAAERYQASPR